MATVKPFRALRIQSELASQVCELPYDVLSASQARDLAAGNPLSFLHVSKPEIDLPANTDPSDPRVYRQGRRRFDNLRDSGALRQDDAACFYVYRQVMERHGQVGLVAVASYVDYLAGVIKRHETTRPEKEDDRFRHIQALNAQTGPVFLIHRAEPEIAAILAAQVLQKPDVDFTARDGVRHTAWSIRDAKAIQQIESCFSRIETLYIADGHHRCAAAARVFRQRAGAGNSPYFLAVIFPHDQLQVLPYHRVVRDLNGFAPAQVLAKLKTVCALAPSADGVPGAPAEIGLYLGGQWHGLRFRDELVDSATPAERLDAALLQTHVLGPVFGIDDPRTSKRIGFVGGVGGLSELRRLVDDGEYACAFAMYPTSVEALMAVADAGLMMPPKSTWFEPKLRDGLFCHLL